MTSPDLTRTNVDKLAELFPSVVTEALDTGGEPMRSIDFDMLRQELSDHIVEGPQERYQLDWPGKRAAAFAANAPIAKTLRPVREESVDFDSTKNLFIEGDNLDALKMLQESYLGRVKLIYIDPPYNTGNDFVYNDDFAESRTGYLERSGQSSAAGDRLVANLESNGRYHSDWLSMMYPRLKLARNLLSDDGVLCASIDANEVHNLRKLGDEVFGARNFIAEVQVTANPRGRQSDSYVAGVHDSLLIWARDRNLASIGGRPLEPEQKQEFNLFDEHLGHYRLLGLRQRGSASRRVDRPEMYFPIYVSPDGAELSLDPVDDWHEVLPRKSDGSDGRWMWGREKCRRDRSHLVPRWIDRRNEFDVFVKDPLVKEGSERLRKFKSVWDGRSFNNQYGTREVKALLGGDFMSFPKPTSLMREIILLGAPDGGIVLDFFAGSSSMAHGVMNVNLEDGKSRPFIMVQLDEAVDESSEAGKAGYRTIADLSKERIRVAAARIRAAAGLEAGHQDLGLRVFKVDTSNMADVVETADALGQEVLNGMVSSVKADRSDEDVLFQVLLDWGLDLSEPISVEVLAERQVFSVAGDALIACFSEDVTDSVVTAIAERHPLRAVFLDAGFVSDAARINTEQLFRELSPETEVRAI